MSPAGLLRDLLDRGVRLYLRGDRLHIKASRGVVSAELLQALREIKPTLLRLAVLNCRSEVKQWPQDRFVDWEERAAIREYHGGLDRPEAERRAYLDVLAKNETSDQEVMSDVAAN